LDINYILFQGNTGVAGLADRKRSNDRSGVDTGTRCDGQRQTAPTELPSRRRRNWRGENVTGEQRRGTAKPTDDLHNAGSGSHGEPATHHRLRVWPLV